MSNKKLPTPNDYIWEWERRAFPYYFYIFNKQWLYKKFSLPVYDVMIYENGTVNTFLHRTTLNRAAGLMLKKVSTNSAFLEQWKKYVIASGERVQRVCHLLSALDFNKLNDTKLAHFFQIAFRAYDAHNLNVGQIRNANRLTAKILTDAYRDPNVVALFLSTPKKSLFIQEHEDLLKIAERVRRNSDSQEPLITKHWKRYFYLPCGYYGEKPYKRHDFTRRLKEIIQHRDSLVEFRAKLRANNRKRLELLTKVRPSARLMRVINFGSACTYFKDYIRGNLNQLQYYNAQIFKAIARRTGNEWQAVAHLFPDEISGLIANPKRLLNRKKIALFSDRNGVHALIGRRASGLIAKFRKPEVYNHSIIRGMPTNPGRASGVALIIGDSKKRPRAGYILIANMTTPDLMPFMKRAKAIVTDEGGVTCHAAIVSRELGIPCVIGTKVATKVFKDGDLVEVDAERGTVKRVH